MEKGKYTFDAEREKALLPSKLSKLLSSSADVKGLADHLRVSQQAINQYKLGVSYPKTENLIKIADYFGISVDYLLDLTDVPNRDTSIQAVNEVTGLSAGAIVKLHEISKGADGPDFLAIISAWIESDQAEPLLSIMRSILEIEINPSIGNELHRLIIGEDEYHVQIRRFLMPLIQDVISAEIPDIAVTYENIRKERGVKNGEH
ncbi:MAG: helix-turn-helix transcriptional regulator [Oscillospiraceae bacterium]|nr:helix-turn-helix transcriptional regulator [Oscillospiraceae bacterium]